MRTEEIGKWIKRSNRKNARLIKSEGGQHQIVYFDKGKARVGYVRDNMLCRYGISCRGAMSSTDPMSLWQAESGACTQKDVQIMIDYLDGKSELPEFDFASIKGLDW